MADTVVIDCTTGDVETRPLTAEEQAQKDADAAEAAAQAKAEADAQAQREADEQAWRDAIANASSIADIKKVLLGTDLPAQAEARHKNAP